MKHENTKINSPAPHLVQEVQELAESKDLVKSLQTKLIEQKEETLKLQKQIELGLSDVARAKLHFELKRDEEIVALKDRLDSTRHQLKMSMDEASSLRERARLLNEQLGTVKDKFELDVEWKKLEAEVREKKEAVLGLNREIETLRKIYEQEVLDLDAARAKYNHEVERIEKILEYKRNVMSEYNEFRKKVVDIPPIPDKLPRFGEEPPKPKKNPVKAFFSRFRRKK